MKGKTKMSKLEKKYYPLYFVLPALIVFTVFYIFSILGGFLFSFTDWSIYNFENPGFIGLSNFKDLFSSPSFLPALGHTFLFAILTTVIKVGLGLIFALLLNRAFPRRNLSALYHRRPGHWLRIYFYSTAGYRYFKYFS